MVKKNQWRLKAYSPIVFASYEDWVAEGTRRFGENMRFWKFVCPACGHVASVQEWVDAGDTFGKTVAFSCVGRWSSTAKSCFASGKGPCDYAGGGLFRLNPVEIKGEDNRFFAFAAGSEG